jgi:hypothetical protein
VKIAENAIAASDDRPRLAFDEDAKGVGVAGKNRGHDATSLRIVLEALVGDVEIARGVDRSVSSRKVARRTTLRW